MGRHLPGSSRGRSYAAPENLGDSVNGATHDADPYIAPDESFLVFASYGRPVLFGDGDLYVSHNRGGSWSGARCLEHDVNSAAREYCPIVSPDGKWLYFTSFRGTIDAPRRRPLTFAQLSAQLRTPLNGYGNVYRIPVAVLADSASP